MIKITAFLAGLFLFACTTTQAQNQKTTEPPSVAQTLNRSLSGVENEFVPAADAMPGDKYSFAPTGGEFKGVRNFSEQLKHVAAVNYLVAAAILQEKPPVELGGESGPASIKTKAEILQFLKDSFAYAHKAVATINETNLLTPIKSPFGEGTTTRLSMATLIFGHCFDHYGQIVVYLRMNGIVPPASRH
ncbi:MAG TPA: DinB family protein [Candidatus Sulfotelmatobacter sp.]|nr:DinB family protein [Candidatus Sulfotelmatobacter sp.]